MTRDPPAIIAAAIYAGHRYARELGTDRSLLNDQPLELSYLADDRKSCPGNGREFGEEGLHEYCELKAMQY